MTRYLGTTWFLAILFLTLKMIEWFLGFPLPEFLHEFNHGDSEIKSLYAEGYLINADGYEHKLRHRLHEKHQRTTRYRRIAPST